MPQPLVIAYHIIWTAYGWWLPNDPRGSGSKSIRKNVLADLGALHFGRKAIQPTRQLVREFYDNVAKLLQFPLLTFDETMRAAIATGFGQVIAKNRYTCYACAIMPDHVHILIRKHKHKAEQMMELLKESSRAILLQAGHRPDDHPTWTKGGWKVFLDEPNEVRRTMAHIEGNPLEIGLPRQEWSFVKPYDDWPLHPGHNPNSPYARAMNRK